MAKYKTIIRAVAFLAVFCLVFLHVQELVTPDYNWPGSFDRLGDSVRGLYKEPDNSLQVLWLGTSHVRNAVSPMLIYRDTGIRSYNLSSAAQTVSLSCARLENAFERQSPQMVFFDVSACFYGEKYATGSKSEGVWRKVIDAIHWSRLIDKFKMSKAMADANGWGLTSTLDGMLPALRYHTNYLLGKADYGNDNAERLALLKGYCQMEYMTAGANDVDEVDMNAGAETEQDARADEERTRRLEEGLQYNRQFLVRMVDLCRRHNCEFVFAKIPLNMHSSDAETSIRWDREKHDMIAEVAESLGCRFLDMNDEDTGIDWNTDSSDGGTHLNNSGAKKASAFLAKWLVEQCDIDIAASDSLDALWDSQWEIYEWENTFYDLQVETDPARYLDLLRNGNYTAFIAVTGHAGEYWSQAMQDQLMRATGARIDLLGDGSESQAYLLVASNGEALVERAKASKNSVKGTLPDGTAYSLTNQSRSSGVKAALTIKGVKHQSDAPGFFIVVYANDFHCVIDRAFIDARTENYRVSHNLKQTRTEFRRALANHEREAMKGL